MRRAYAVRNEVLGDPDFVTIDQADLLSPAFSAALRASIAPEHATPSEEISGRPAPAESRQTTHFSVVDAAGNGVALTTTINGWYGSGVDGRGRGVPAEQRDGRFRGEAGHAEHVRAGAG